jgi:hypothetical protein
VQLVCPSCTTCEPTERPPAASLDDLVGKVMTLAELVAALGPPSSVVVVPAAACAACGGAGRRVEGDGADRFSYPCPDCTAADGSYGTFADDVPL